VTRINQPENDDSVRFFGILATRKALGNIESKHVSCAGVSKVAFPVQSITIPYNIRSELRFLKCELTINVAYPTSIGGFVQKRSLAIPVSLISNNLPDLTTYAYWMYAESLHHQLILIDASVCMMKLVGMTSFNGEMVQVLRGILPSSEVERTLRIIVPSLVKLEAGESTRVTHTFATVHGEKTVDLMWYKTRNIVVGVWLDQENDM